MNWLTSDASSVRSWFSSYLTAPGWFDQEVEQPTVVVLKGVSTRIRIASLIPTGDTTVAPEATSRLWVVDPTNRIRGWFTTRDTALGWFDDEYSAEGNPLTVVLHLSTGALEASGDAVANLVGVSMHLEAGSFFKEEEAGFVRSRRRRIRLRVRNAVATLVGVVLTLGHGVLVASASAAALFTGVATSLRTGFLRAVGASCPPAPHVRTGTHAGTLSPTANAVAILAGVTTHTHAAHLSAVGTEGPHIYTVEEMNSIILLLEEAA
jgi:hypothetical protein